MQNYGGRKLKSGGDAGSKKTYTKGYRGNWKSKGKFYQSGGQLEKKSVGTRARSVSERNREERPQVARVKSVDGVICDFAYPEDLETKVSRFILRLSVSNVGGSNNGLFKEGGVARADWVIFHNEDNGRWIPPNQTERFIKTVPEVSEIILDGSIGRLGLIAISAYSCILYDYNARKGEFYDVLDERTHNSLSSLSDLIFPVLFPDDYPASNTKENKREAIADRGNQNFAVTVASVDTKGEIQGVRFIPVVWPRNGKGSFFLSFPGTISLLRAVDVEKVLSSFLAEEAGNSWKETVEEVKKCGSLFDFADYLRDRVTQKSSRDRLFASSIVAFDKMVNYITSKSEKGISGNTVVVSDGQRGFLRAFFTTKQNSGLHK